MIPFLAAGQARAADDPFDLDGGHWMSFDHYTDASRRGILAPAKQPAPDSSSNGTAPGEAATADTITPPSLPMAGTPPAATAVAAPMRPLDLPPMPGLNKGYDIKVTSTEDNTAPPPAPVLSADNPPDIHLADKNWQEPQAAMRYQTNANGDEEEAPPLAVRMTFLPDSKITPIPTPDFVSDQHKARQALAQGIVKPKPQEQSPAELAACAAIDAYKKQQLDAIQSDRQTLKALQDAIASLGLQKQLGFMTGSDSALNTPAGSTQLNIDMPPQTTVR